MATLRQIRRRIRTVDRCVSGPPRRGRGGIGGLWDAPGFSLGCEGLR